jgi:hypothetical protein
MRVLAQPSVQLQDLKNGLGRLGYDWKNLGHVTATESLAQELSRDVATNCLPISLLLDLVVVPGASGHSVTNLDSFPRISLLGTNEYQENAKRWRQEVTGERLKQSILFDQKLRDWLGQQVLPAPLKQVIRSSTREIRRAILTLAASGLHPEDLHATTATQSPTELQSAVLSLWKFLEVERPEISDFRQDLWIDMKEYLEQETQSAKALQKRIANALEVAFGAVAERRVLVHHGFYFYTPPQWAFFKLLEATPNIEQIFVVHDDGQNPVFKTWRTFFNDKLEMPNFEIQPLAHQVTNRARMFQNAVTGLPVKADTAVNSTKITRCRYPSDLVRTISYNRIAQESADQREPVLFSAKNEEISSLLGRLGSSKSSSGVNLAQLPVGVFLISLHRSINLMANGRTSVNLSQENFLAIASSGFVSVQGTAPNPAQLAAARRALPFFKNCTTIQDWVLRAKSLHQLILDEVSHFGARQDAHNDLERLDSAAKNLLRLVPWADISVSDAEWLAALVTNVGNIINELASQERISLKEHSRFLATKLENGLAHLNSEERDELSAKLRGFDVGIDEDVDVQAILDVVTMLLNRKADFGGVDLADEPNTLVKPLRNLDTLGLRRCSTDVHLMNLSDGAFPSRADLGIWPFTLDFLEESGARQITLDLLRARRDTSTLSDLYLFWLALDGVSDNAVLTLSWIERLGNDLRNPSTILQALLTISSTPSAGGLSEHKPVSAGEFSATLEMPNYTGIKLTENQISAISKALPQQALASSIACPRRMALQWITGPTHSHFAEHSLSMLYGNLGLALARFTGADMSHCDRTAKDLFRFKTAGELASSLSNSRVNLEYNTAKPDWIFTLNGAKTRNDPLSKAYQAAIATDRVMIIEHLRTQSFVGPLPRAQEATRNECKMCPVSQICLMQITQLDD